MRTGLRREEMRAWVLPQANLEAQISARFVAEARPAPRFLGRIQPSLPQKLGVAIGSSFGYNPRLLEGAFASRDFHEPIRCPRCFPFF